MPSAVGAMFVLYIVVSIVSGIVSSVVRQSQKTARRRKPVYVPGEQVPHPAEVDIREPEEQGSPAAGEGYSGWTAVEEQAGPAVGEGYPGWTAIEQRLDPTAVDGYSGVTDDGSAVTDDRSSSAVAERFQRIEAAKGLRAGNAGPGWQKSLAEAPDFPARLLLSDREQLRAVIIAIEVLGKPKGLTM